MSKKETEKLQQVVAENKEQANEEQIVSTVSTQSLIQDLRQIIEQARNRVAAKANAELTMMYWHIGERINTYVLGNERAEYGKQIVSQVTTQLQEEYGARGFDEKNIRRMMKFARVFPDVQIVAPVVRQLSWSHFLIVMSLKDEIQREFYITMAASEGWSKRTPFEKDVAQWILDNADLTDMGRQFLFGKRKLQSDVIKLADDYHRIFSSGQCDQCFRQGIGQHRQRCVLGCGDRGQAHFPCWRPEQLVCEILA